MDNFSLLAAPHGSASFSYILTIVRVRSERIFSLLVQLREYALSSDSLSSLILKQLTLNIQQYLIKY